MLTGKCKSHRQPCCMTKWMGYNGLQTDCTYYKSINKPVTTLKQSINQFYIELSQLHFPCYDIFTFDFFSGQPLKL